jgi:hypothetical protein
MKHSLQVKRDDQAARSDTPVLLIVVRVLKASAEHHHQ